MDWPLLNSLEPDQRSAVLRATTRRAFRRGQAIFHEGDPGESYHLIATGKVAIQVSTPDGDLVTLEVLGAGDGFGELALVGDDARRSATARALERVETLAMDRRDFVELCRQRPESLSFIVATLVEQVRRLSTSVIEAHTLSADVLVARRLLRLADLYGPQPPVRIPITQEELSSIVGNTRPTVNRVLRALTDCGVLELGRGQITILDLEALADRAGALGRSTLRAR